MPGFFSLASNGELRVMQMPEKGPYSYAYYISTEYHMTVAQLENRSANWQDLASRTLDHFNVIIGSAENEGSIQGGIISVLMDYIGLVLNPKTLAVMEIPFNKQCQLPVQILLDENSKSIMVCFDIIGIDHGMIF